MSLTLNGRNAVSDRQVIRGELLTQAGTALLGRSASVDFLVIANGMFTFRGDQSINQSIDRSID